jgi:molybdopterin synthase catalytic subunit
MTEAQIGKIVDEACARWPLLGVTVIHRVGELHPGDRIVFVGTASAHRGAALESCAFLIDWLKTSAPFWKKEHFEDGHSDWVEARAEDDTALERWK